MTINTHYNPHRVDWTKTQSAPGSTRAEGVSPKAGCGGDMSVWVAEGAVTRRTAVGGKVKLELPNGVFDFDTGMSAIEAIDKIIKDGNDYGDFSDWFGEKISKLDDEELNKLSEYLAKLKEKAPANSMILNMIELMQILIELNQKMRENENLMYQGEGERARSDLKQKASLTRSGTVQNFAMNMIGTGISLGFSGISLWSSVSNLKSMTRTMNEGFGLEKMELSASSDLTNSAKAQAQARSMEVSLAQTKDSAFELVKPAKSETPTTPGGAGMQEETVGKPVEPSRAREGDDFHLLDQDLEDAAPGPNIDTPMSEQEVTDIGRMPKGEGAERIMEVDNKTFTKSRELLFDKDGNFQICDSEGNPIPYEELPLKPGVLKADLKEVKTVRQALEVLDLEPRAVDVESGAAPQGGTDKIAEQFKAEFKEKLSGALSADYQTARSAYTMLAENIDSLKGAIKAGTYEDLGYADKAAAKAALETMQSEAAGLKVELRYVKAVEVAGQAKCMNAQEIAKVQDSLQGKLETAKHKCINSSRYKVLENKLQMAGTWSSVGAAFEKVFSGIGGYLQGLRQAEGTEAEIEQSRHQQIQEMLKQLADRNKEGFNEMVDLMKAALTSGTNMRATMA